MGSYSNLNHRRLVIRREITKQACFSHICNVSQITGPERAYGRL